MTFLDVFRKKRTNNFINLIQTIYMYLFPFEKQNAAEYFKRSALIKIDEKIDLAYISGVN